MMERQILPGEMIAETIAPCLHIGDLGVERVDPGGIDRFPEIVPLVGIGHGIHLVGPNTLHRDIGIQETDHEWHQEGIDRPQGGDQNVGDSNTLAHHFEVEQQDVKEDAGPPLQLRGRPQGAKAGLLPQGP